MPNDSNAAAEGINFLSGLLAHGGSPQRMVQATAEMVLHWQGTAEDETELRTWLETLWQSLNDGVLAQEEALGNLDPADTRSGPVIERILGGLQDSRAVVTAALDRV